MSFKVRRPIAQLKLLSQRRLDLWRALWGRPRQADGLKRVALIAAMVATASVLMVGVLAAFLATRLPNIDNLGSLVPNQTTKILAKDGSLLADLHEEENRSWVPLDQIQPIMQRAVVSLEDVRFYQHHGLDFRRIGTAALVDAFHGQAVQGASTLTQQLARNVYLSHEKTLARKISEALLAVQIERKYTKDEILEMYLNMVYWGHNAYGIESASQTYFGKHASELSMAESALLVGLLKGPELYTPYRNMKGALARRNTVLTVMWHNRLISKAQLKQALKDPIKLLGLKKFRFKSPYFCTYVIAQLEKMYDREMVYQGGLKVYTTLDAGLDEAAYQIITSTLAQANMGHALKDGKRFIEEGALMSVDPRTGYILSMQGGSNYNSSQFNRCTQALRQPGSSFKPFVYLTALAKGFSPGSFILDAPVTYQTVAGPYEPINYTKTYLGLIPMRKALERSINVVAIKLNDLLGPEACAQTAKALGISTPIAPVLSLPLGANEVTMFDMVRAYGCFANAGKLVNPVAILRIEDRNGVEIYKHVSKEQSVFDPNKINTLVDMLRGVVLHGTGTAAYLPIPMAGKTGTTNDNKDAWFIGFTPTIVTATWVGNDDNREMPGVTGGLWPAMMWHNYMQQAIVGRQITDFPRPQGLLEAKVCWAEGKLARPECPAKQEVEDPDSDKRIVRVTTEKYWVGHEPKELCTTHDPANAVASDEQVSNNQSEKDAPWVKDFFR